MNWHDDVVKLTQAAKALEEALREVEPKLYFKTTQRDDGQLRSVISLDLTGGPRMSLLSEYYQDAAQDPEHMRSYAERIIAKLRQEKPR